MGYHERVQYIADEMGFVLYDRAAGGIKRKRESEPGPESCRAAERLSVDRFGPYFVKHKDRLQQCLERYDERQGKGFICWRFVMSMSKQDMTSLSRQVSAGAGEQPTSLALD